MELAEMTRDELMHMRDELDKLIFYILKDADGHVTPEFSLAVAKVTEIKKFLKELDN